MVLIYWIHQKSAFLFPPRCPFINERPEVGGVAAVQETYDLLETLNRHTANTGTLYFLKQQGGTFVAVFIIVAESRYLNCVVWDQCKLSYSVFVVLFIGKSCFSCSIVEQPHICTSRWETLVYFMAVTVITYFLLL